MQHPQFCLLSHGEANTVGVSKTTRTNRKLFQSRIWRWWTYVLDLYTDKLNMTTYFTLGNRQGFIPHVHVLIKLYAVIYGTILQIYLKSTYFYLKFKLHRKQKLYMCYQF